MSSSNLPNLAPETRPETPLGQRPRWPWWVGYVIAASIIVIVTTVLHLLEPVLPIAHYPVTYALPIMGIAFVFGIGPAIVACVLAFAFYAYHFMPPSHSIRIDFSQSATVAQTIAFLLNTATVGLFALLMRRAKRRVEEMMARLQESSAQTIGILETIEEGFITTDAEDRIIYANREAERLAQRPRDELMEEKLWDALPDLNRSAFAQQYRLAVSSHSPATFDMLYPSRAAILDIRIYPTEHGASIFFRDDTARKKAEEAVRDNEAKYRSLAETAADAVVTCDSQGIIVYWNKAAEKMFGHSEEEAVGQSDTIMMPERFRDMHPKAVARASSAGEFKVVGQTVELPALRKDGTEFPVEFSLSTWTTEAGRFYTVIIRDVTERKRAEEALAASETRYRTLFESATDAVMMLDEKGFFDCNESALRIFGLSDRGELLSVHPWELSPPYQPDGTDSVTAVHRRDAEAFEKGSSHFEWMHRRRNGEDFPADVLLTAFNLGDRRVLQATVRDITEQKKAAAALEESETRFRELFQYAADGILVHEVGKEGPPGHFTEANDTACRMLGYTKEELLKMPPVDLMPPIEKGRAPEFSRQVEETGRVTFETTLLTKGGEPVPVEINSHTFDLGGSRVMLSSLRDITERKKAEDALRTLSRAAEQSPASVVIMDTDGNITYVNPKFTEVTGYAPDEVRGRKPPVLEPEGKSEEEYRALWATLDAGGEWRGETQSQRKSGELFWESAVISPMRDEKGLITHFVAVKEDITERKRAEEEIRRVSEDLERSNADLQQFAYIASHDLQEPLRAVSSYLQLIEKRYHGKLDKDADEFIEYAVDGASRMQALIQGLLDYSRVGTRGKDFAPTDSETVLQQAEQNLKVAIEESGAEITHDPLPTVTGDDMQLTELLQNLIGNAVKFHKEGANPEVHVSAKHEDGEWVFSVRDNGIGMSPEDAERIFQIFTRVGDTEKYGGTGIGLAVCKRIVERHGGRIWVESAVGKGSTFYFTIPATETAAAPAAEMEKAA